MRRWLESRVSEALPIIAQGDSFVVIEKPSGLLSVPGKGPNKQDCVAARVRAMFPSATGPLIVHRLDMETSGLLVFGLSPDAQRELSRQFEQRTTTKAYISLLTGLLANDEGEVSLPIRADIDNRPHQIVDHVHGRPSLTKYRVLAREIDRTRVRFEPVTGRAHQLRVHAAVPISLGGLGAPILGDPLYGDAASAERLMLHAAELSFNDPISGRRVECRSPTPF
ncbi:MAG: RluA family pseudouridine synthase [Planctomycetes bacterium]|nr:RluA family pseudouridine synthase [Planctomycetota bacterium]